MIDFKNVSSFFAIGWLESIGSNFRISVPFSHGTVISLHSGVITIFIPLQLNVMYLLSNLQSIYGKINKNKPVNIIILFINFIFFIEHI